MSTPKQDQNDKRPLVFKEVFASALEKDYRVYFFDRTDDEVEVRDISSLDPGDDDDRVAGWGGLSGFSGRIADIVGDALSPSGARGEPLGLCHRIRSVRPGRGVLRRSPFGRDQRGLKNREETQVACSRITAGRE